MVRDVRPPVSVLLGLALLLAQVITVAAERNFDLVDPRRCLVGGGPSGEPSIEWRIQLGVFGERAAEDRLLKQAHGARLDSEAFVALWMPAGSEDEPHAVVS